MGLWANYMTVFCWLNPQTMKLCCFNIKFSRKLFPFIFSLIISFIYWNVRVDLIAGLVLGLLQATLLKNTRNILKLEFYQFFDNIFCRIGLSKLSNWVPLIASHYAEKLCTLNVYSKIES